MGSKILDDFDKEKFKNTRQGDPGYKPHKKDSYQDMVDGMKDETLIYSEDFNDRDDDDLSPVNKDEFVMDATI